LKQVGRSGIEVVGFRVGTRNLTDFCIQYVIDVVFIFVLFGFCFYFCSICCCSKIFVDLKAQLAVHYQTYWIQIANKDKEILHNTGHTFYETQIYNLQS
jgi:hypothetical protein